MVYGNLGKNGRIVTYLADWVHSIGTVHVTDHTMAERTAQEKTKKVKNAFLKNVQVLVSYHSFLVILLNLVIDCVLTCTV